MARTHEIRVFCKDGDFEYEYNGKRSQFSTVWVHHGDTIRWVCENPKQYLATHIGFNSPFDKCRYRCEAGSHIQVTVTPTAQPGNYKYTVAVFDIEKIWTDDPEFIVRG